MANFMRKEYTHIGRKPENPNIPNKPIFPKHRDYSEP